MLAWSSGSAASLRRGALQRGVEGQREDEGAEEVALLSLSLSLTLSFDRQNGFVYYTTRILLAITSQCRAMPGPLTTRHKCTVYGDDDLSLSVCLSVSLSVLS